MPGTDRVKATLAALADGETADRVADADADSPGTSREYQRVIDRAARAREDLETAAAFLDDVGLDGLDRAIDAAEAELSGRADAGREARAAFDRYRDAAEADHFHPAHDTSLGGAGVRHDE